MKLMQTEISGSVKFKSKHLSAVLEIYILINIVVGKVIRPPIVFYVKHMFSTQFIIIANEAGYPPDSVVVLRNLFQGNINNAHNAFMQCCSLALVSN